MFVQFDQGSLTEERANKFSWGVVYSRATSQVARVVVGDSRLFLTTNRRGEAWLKQLEGGSNLTVGSGEILYDRAASGASDQESFASREGLANALLMGSKGVAVAQRQKRVTAARNTFIAQSVPADVELAGNSLPGCQPFSARLTVEFAAGKESPRGRRFGVGRGGERTRASPDISCFQEALERIGRGVDDPKSDRGFSGLEKVLGHFDFVMAGGPAAPAVGAGIKGPSPLRIQWSSSRLNPFPFGLLSPWGESFVLG